MADANVERILRYQGLLHREKLLLLAIPEAREMLANELDHILEEGLFRSMKRELIHELCDTLRGPIANEKKEVIDHLLALPFYEDFWNPARKIVKLGEGNSPTPAALAWDQAFQEATRERNLFLEEYAFLIPKMIHCYFPAVTPAVASDLESEGILGLFRALESYHPDRKGDLRIHIQTRILSMVMDSYKETEYAKAQHSQKVGHEHDHDKEHADDPDHPHEPIHEHRSIMVNLHEVHTTEREGPRAILMSLDDPVPFSDDSHYSDIIVGETENPFEVAEGRQVLMRIQASLASKPPVERFLIYSKWNFDESGIAEAEPCETEEAAAKLRSEAARRLRAGG